MFRHLRGMFESKDNSKETPLFSFELFASPEAEAVRLLSQAIGAGEISDFIDLRSFCELELSCIFMCKKPPYANSSVYSLPQLLKKAPLTDEALIATRLKKLGLMVSSRLLMKI